MSEASFGRFPISVPAACAVRAADRHRRVAFSCLLLLATTREVGRLPGRDPAWSSGRTACLLHPPTERSCEAALRCATFARRKARLLRLLSGETVRLHCRGDKPGLGPAADRLLLLRQKKSARKGDPTMAVRCADCTRRQRLKREASETRWRSDSGRFFIRFRRQRRVAI